MAQLIITWSPPADCNGCTYEYRYKLSSASTYVTGSTSNTIVTINGLIDAQTYNYSVRTICPDAGGNLRSRWLNGSSVTCNTNPPLQPTPTPTVNHIIIVNGDGVSVTHDYTSGGCGSDFDETSNLSGSGVNSIYYLTISLFPNSKIEDPNIDSIVSSFLEYVDGVTISNILTGLTQNYTEITKLLTSNQTSEQLGVMGNKIEQSYFDCLNFLGGSIWNNEFNNQSIFSSNLFSPNQSSTFSGNVLTNNTLFNNNVIVDDYKIYSSYCDSTELTDNNFSSYFGNPNDFGYNTLNNVFFQYNTISSSVEYNEFKGFDFINNEFLDSIIRYNKISNIFSLSALSSLTKLKNLHIILKYILIIKI